MLRWWSVVKLGLNICFFLLSRCRCLLSCCCESITCFFLHSHWWRYEEPEGINSSLSFRFRLSANRGGASKRSCPAGDGLSTGLHCFIATKWLGSNTAPCLLSKFPYLDHKMETFLSKNKLCLCRGAMTPCTICDSSSPTSGYRDAKQTISSAGQSLPKPSLLASVVHCLLPTIDCFKELHQVVH